MKKKKKKKKDEFYKAKDISALFRYSVEKLIEDGWITEVKDGKEKNT